MQQNNKLNSMKQQNHEILKLQTKKYPLYKPHSMPKPLASPVPASSLARTVRRRKTNHRSTDRPVCRSTSHGTQFRIHHPRINLVRTYLRRLPTLRESQAASFFLGWPRRSQQVLPKRRPKSECSGASQPTSASSMSHTIPPPYHKPTLPIAS